jgi:hypothetical protein
VRSAPACLGLDDLSPERDLAEDAADGVRLVAAAQVRQRVDRIASGVEAAVADQAWNRMQREALRERILVLTTRGQGMFLRNPDDVVQHRAQPEPSGGLGHDPRAPANDRIQGFAQRVPGLHYRAPA